MIEKENIICPWENRSLYISIILPTYRHPWEIDKAIFSLERQVGIKSNEYEVIIINDDPKDLDTLGVAAKYHRWAGNIRYIEVYDAEKVGITNAGRCGNIGARSYARGDVLILIVDSARIITSGAIAKTRILFESRGSEIVTTVHPYHIGKHYSDSSWTPEACRKLMDEVNWEEDPYMLFDHCAHTKISETGNITESTFQGMTREHFLEIGGWNEIYKSWGVHNLDLWRRCIKPKPIDGKVIFNEPGHWGKIGLGLEPINIEGEGTFHIHHDITVPRDHGNFNRDNQMAWSEYDRLKDCIHANIERPDWGRGDTKEINLEEI